MFASFSWKNKTGEEILNRRNRDTCFRSCTLDLDEQKGTRETPSGNNKVLLENFKTNRMSMRVAQILNLK